ncbi:ABC-F family ATP-binding cassette domain-containing protein [Roseiterribacter gracilis]|uniref:Glycosyl transferase family 1 n=1 Tax=Roseiterribacter gracilis TaxID=2812848 RepID=A0A8S8X7P8_9PROT|nr:glycosyl transferase family 1 [Rhodospirillales bacterium TMPK1]
MLQINDVTVRIAGRTLLDQASVTVPTGHKASLIGPNGAGKSTLLKVLSGRLQPDGGDVAIPANARLGMVAQEAPGGAITLIDAVLAADTERAALLEEAETATDGHRIADIHERLGVIDAYAAPSRAAEILAGLGFDEERQQRACSDFSGGWRMRVALAATLFARPDILLLDEPTNHLDLEATVWLEGWLKSFPGTVLLVSHDRTLLNAVPDLTIHLDQAKLVLYRGNYDQYERQRNERLVHQAAAAARQAAERAHIQSFVDRFRAKASKAAQAQSRLKALAKMQPIAAIVENRGIVFNFPEPEELPPPIVSMDRASVGYEGKAILSHLNLRIDPDDRIALLGPNGNGKSTFIKLLAGRLEAMSGHVTRSGKLKIGYFAQHQTDELDMEATALLNAKRAMPTLPEQKVRAHLGGFGFTQNRVDTKVGSLSGGEKARLLFALMTREAPNVLLLDEPTNHLDVDSREALVQALADYKGAVILVTHDPHLVELVADRLWLVEGGRVENFDGDMDEYRARLLSQRRSASRGESKQRRSGMQGKVAPSKLKKQAEELEKTLEQLNQKHAKLERDLADPKLYESKSAKLATMQKELADIAASIATTEEKWIEAQQLLDAAE